ncbi:MAG: PhnD/SsuA/transferrin family substrate-binding protein [Kiloniellales bacterium]|nr:PhnD/SsuA/transferrin family substrate-binding protein [Kiloniellales bacterium]
MGVASMPMYDLPEVRGALDGLWTGLARYLRREGLKNVPRRLVHGRPLGRLWNDPELWFSQCCGYDLVKGYAGTLIPVATPRFGAPECEGCNYASVVVVRDDCKFDDVLEMRGAVCVINGPESHSGMNAMRALIAPKCGGRRFFSQLKVSGTHADSLATIQRGEADVAAVDCVTFALLERHRPAALAGLRKLGRTYRAPGIPYVTRATVPEDTVVRMRAALFHAFDDPRLAGVRQALLLDGLAVLPLSRYSRIAVTERIADRYGCPQFA